MGCSPLVIPAISCYLISSTHPKSQTPILRKHVTLYSSGFPLRRLSVLPWTSGIDGSDGIAREVERDLSYPRMPEAACERATVHTC